MTDYFDEDKVWSEFKVEHAKEFANTAYHDFFCEMLEYVTFEYNDDGDVYMTVHHSMYPPRVFLRTVNNSRYSDDSLDVDDCFFLILYILDIEVSEQYPFDTLVNIGDTAYLISDIYSLFSDYLTDVLYSIEEVLDEMEEERLAEHAYLYGDDYDE